MKRQTIIICFAALLLLLANCSQQSPNSPEGTVVTIRASLKGLGVGSDIVKVILKVSGDDFDTLTHQLQLEQGEATAEIEIPFGSNRHFAMSAFNSDSVVLYQGETTANVIAGVPTEVVIYLEPQVTMLRISPMYSETLLGSTDTFKVMIHHIDSLFGIALRIRYDPEIISITGVIPGDVFSSADFIFFPWVDSDYVALGYSLQARQDTLGVNLPQGVSPRSATIAEIVYEARGLGPTTLNFLQEEGKSPKLIDWQGNPLPRQEHLYIENGEVEVYGP